MTKIKRLFLGAALAVLSIHAQATSLSPRFGVLLMSTGTVDWGTKLNTSVFSIFDSSAADQRAPNTFTSSNTFLAPLLASNTSFTLTGANGFIAGQSSITTTGSFFGSAANVGAVIGSGGTLALVSSSGASDSQLLMIEPNATLTAGASVVGGSVGLNGGSGSGGAGGNVNLKAGNGSSSDGAINFTGGDNVSNMVITNGSVVVGAANGLSVTNTLTVVGTETVNGNAFSVGGSSFTVTGGSATVAYQMTAKSFSGDGSLLTGLPSSANNTFQSVNGVISQVFSTNTVVMGSTLTVNGPIVSTGTNGGAIYSGAGTRFEWIPSSAAFRAGGVGKTEWDPANIGGYSVAFGTASKASGFASFAGGANTQALSDYSVVVGGYGNIVQTGTTYGFIGAGINNTIGGQFATVSGGSANSATGSSLIAGGVSNVASGTGGVVGGGGSNTAFGGNYNTVCGGQSNKAGKSDGTTNATTIAGGVSNVAAAGNATISGGTNNVASWDYATVGGGNTNKINAGQYATIGGGSNNQINAVVGADNAGTIPGGENNAVSGQYAFAAGQRAKAGGKGSFVWNDSTALDLVGNTTDQFLVRSQGGFYINTSSFTVRASSGPLIFSVDTTSMSVTVPANASGIDSNGYSLLTSSGISVLAGQINLASGGAGIVFPDGSRQKTAAAGGSGDVVAAGNNSFTGNNTHGGQETFSAGSTVTIVNADSNLSTTTANTMSRDTVVNTWVNWIGSNTVNTAVTILGHRNVASVSHPATGVYLIQFGTPYPSVTSYTCFCSVNRSPSNGFCQLEQDGTTTFVPKTLNTITMNVQATSAANQDCPRCSVMCIGTQ